jgi:hypothetical protein
VLVEGKVRRRGGRGNPSDYNFTVLLRRGRELRMNLSFYFAEAKEERARK